MTRNNPPRPSGKSGGSGKSAKAGKASKPGQVARPRWGAKPARPAATDRDGFTAQTAPLAPGEEPAKPVREPKGPGASKAERPRKQAVRPPKVLRTAKPVAKAVKAPAAPRVPAGDPLVGERYEVEVGAVAHGGGHCVARHEGRVLFVRHALPGERVIAQVTEGTTKSRFLRADAVEILEAAKDRIAPPCPFAGPGRCGGCDWQHVTPGGQRKLKVAVLTEQLAKLAGLTPAEAGWDGSVEPVGGKLPAGEVPAWRSRVQYAVDPASGKVGLRKHRSHEIQPIDRCLIAAEGVTELGIEARDWPGITSIDAVAATGSSDRQIILTPAPGAQLPLVELDKPVSISRIDEHDNFHRVHGRTFVREVAAGRTWRVSNGGFWQIHPEAPDTLVDAVLDGLDPQWGENALDLYCGVGLFAGALADRVGEDGAVLGIESSKQAVVDARHNLAALDNVRIEHDKVESLLPRTGITSTDLIVLDPPRAGAGRETVAHLAGLEARRIAYVACDPAALARDLAFFREGGYRPVSLRAFDLFPMTHHFECVAILEPIAE
ncbi:class I SAM-dependent RNA methyltransferase [Kitasatospora atroaurantiaca]|uniref:tRNA/tmRNA/rRNA uracil-C5-methylase (TrmA/RlmC/RlmD family) n=1 Tax=Kitasatospora atroaurantiaca TaxID=285545 RepID=A0A561EP34_9ACTN|nr:tRNA/tmRNA/rRNA uracil-C5-methylase (TrmA/RlmC/RlmD family) [Kitasatospora atroaurantiaca]